VSEQDTYCFFCESIRAKDAGVTHVSISESEHKHGSEIVYVVRVAVGGDTAACTKFAAMVQRYVSEVLGNKTVVDITPKPTGKPN
jgi:uncharacterized protein YcnI